MAGMSRSRLVGFIMFVGLIGLGGLGPLAGCGAERHDVSDAIAPMENCDVVGDEDGNGLADCDDQVCSHRPECLPMCGNGELELGEDCDDGNTADGDTCESDCTFPRCGNGIHDAGEACDDGNATDGDACESDCTLPVCGNGIRDAGEQCDDRNLADGDGCSATCLVTRSTYVKATNSGAGDQLGTSVALSADGSTLVVGAVGEDSAATGIGGAQANNGAPDSGAVYVYTRSGETWKLQAYIKASNTDAGDMFGASVAVSADGSTLAVGATGEASSATGTAGTAGDQADDSAPFAGAVYVFTRSGETWSQAAYLKASNTGADDQFGTSVALSADGSTLAAGASNEASMATGIDGDQADDSIAGAGAVYVFTRDGAAWIQRAYVKSSNNDEGDGFGDAFGYAVALSGDGSTLAVGAVVEDSAATGIDGDQTDNSSSSAGAVYVFTRDGNAWRQQAYVKASNTDATDNFGISAALSGDGSTLAVGAAFEDSSATGVDGNQRSNATAESGAVYVFTRSGAVWTQQAYVKASNTGGGDQFGWSVALSTDGSLLAVGASTEDSSATGVGGDQINNSATAAGSVYRFTRAGTTWSQRAYIKASNTNAGDQFGYSVALSASGTLAVGAVGEDSAAITVGGNQASNTAPEAGAVYVLQ